MNYDCSSRALENHDKTEGLACMAIIKSRSTLLQRWTCKGVGVRALILIKLNDFFGTSRGHRGYGVPKNMKRPVVTGLHAQKGWRAWVWRLAHLFAFVMGYRFGWIQSRRYLGGQHNGKLQCRCIGLWHCGQRQIGVNGM